MNTKVESDRPNAKRAGLFQFVLIGVAVADHAGNAASVTDRND
jgi:hypothetical protein